MNESIPNEKINLTGQVTIVTGGGRGLGRAYALALAGAGAAVAVTARSKVQLAETVTLIEKAGGRSLAVTADVTDQQAVDRVIEDTERQFGPVDLLVNNAGRSRLLGEIWELDPEEWWRTIEVNLRGPFLYTQAVLPSMVSRRCGRVINLASGAGLGAPSYFSAYGISKAALIRFSEILAAESREYGISVFVIHPGNVLTPMNKYFVDSVVPELPAHLEKRFEWMLTYFEEGKGTPIEESVQLVLTLASGKADALTGCYISVYDDVEEMVQRAEEIQEKQLYTLRLRT